MSQEKISQYISSLSIILLALFIAMLFFHREYLREKEVEEKTSSTDSLLNEITKLNNEVAALKQEVFDAQKSVFDNHFDPYDGQNYRIYGLFRDKSKDLTAYTLAKRFNISNDNAIKSSEVKDEVWYIVPVKGVHYFRKGETITSISKLYYPQASDSTLIKEFNKGNLKPERYIFIPFDE